ncbi:MAG: HAD-IC family P-type ATPase [Clostridia bacterium]
MQQVKQHGKKREDYREARDVDKALSGVTRALPSLELGLSDEEVKMRQLRGETNVKNAIANQRSVLEIILRNIFSAINIIYMIVLGILFYIGAYDYTYSGIMLIANLGISIWLELRSRKIINKKRFKIVQDITVIRNGERKKISFEQLVVDDVFVVEGEMRVPADAKIAEGFLFMDEAVFRGGNHIIKKSVGDQIMAATTAMIGNAICRATGVGNARQIMRLINPADKSNGAPQSKVFKIVNRMTATLGGCAVLCALFMFCVEFFMGNNLNISFIRLSSAIMTMLPIGMFLVSNSCIALSVSKVIKFNVIPQTLDSLETLAIADVVLIDKTGTLTNNKWQVDKKKFFGEAQDNLQDVIVTAVTEIHAQPAFERAMLAECMFGKPIEYSSIEEGDDYVAITLTNGHKYAIGHITAVSCYNRHFAEFCSEEENIGRYLVGVVSFDDDVENFDKSVTTPLAVFAMSDSLRYGAYSVVDWLINEGIEVKMFSGDDGVVVSKVAERCGIEKAERYVNCQWLTNKELQSKMKGCNVFGTVSPKQKMEIVDCLQEQGKTVVVIGDGANDALALNEADCAIVLDSATETCKYIADVLVADNDLTNIVKAFQEGQRAVYNVKKIVSLYAMKNIFIMLAVVFFSVGGIMYNEFFYPFDLKRMLMIEIFATTLPALCMLFQNKDTYREYGQFFADIVFDIAAGVVSMSVTVIVILLMSTNFGLHDLPDYANQRDAVSSIIMIALLINIFVILIYMCSPLTRIKSGIIMFCVGLCFMVGFVNNAYYGGLLLDISALGLEYFGWTLLANFFGLSAFVISVKLKRLIYLRCGAKVNKWFNYKTTKMLEARRGK